MNYVKAVLAKVDVEFFKKFRERYPGWDIVRYEDNSLEFIKPERGERIKAVKKSIIH